MNSLQIYDTEFEKVRIGRGHDGGYIVAKIPGTYDILISGGISDDITFECDFLKLHSEVMTCVAFDGTIDSLPAVGDVTVREKIQFYRQNLGSTNSETISNLSNHLKGCKNAFLKLDIEGHEFRLLPILFMHKLMNNVKQLVIEFHTVGEIQKYPDYFKSTHDNLADITNEYQLSVFEELKKTHCLIHVHANNASAWYEHNGFVLPNVFECTYIRNDLAVNSVAKEANLVLPMSNIDQRNHPWLAERRYVWFPFRNVSLKHFDFYYGLDGQFMISINSVLKQLCIENSDRFEIPATEEKRAAYFSDPTPGFLKSIRINYKGTQNLFCNLTEYQTIVISN